MRVVQLSLKNKIARAVWHVVWLLFFRPTPRLMHFWRCWLLRLFGAKLGKSLRMYPTARVWAPWNLEMDDHSCLGDYVDCYCVDKIHIGEHSTVSQYGFLCSASRDYTDALMPLVVAPIIIGKRVWVTAGVFVGPGVSIGDGAVVAARSVVVKDVEPWDVVAGNPARVIKKRVLTTGTI
ncbi:MAG: putative colanic acid biosynthesis acetyltransferase [Chlorobium sp.]|nr:putative colanic acid biosynthesis acetyltransferase [Chlorobium sp.]